MKNTFPQLMKRSGVPNAAPRPDELEIGQIAINYHDECLFIKNIQGDIVRVACADAVLRALSSVASVNGIVPDKDGNLILDPKDIGEHGVVPLDQDGRIDPSYLSEHYLYKLGTWNPTSNTPALPDPATVPGGYLIINANGEHEGVEYYTSDWLVSDGTRWDTIRNGTVSSIGIDSDSGVLSVSGSPVTRYGNITINLSEQPPNTVLAGSIDSEGDTSIPTFRMLVRSDLPVLDEGEY